MPRRARHPCLHPNCPALVNSGEGSYCEKHRKARQAYQDDKRPSAGRRGYNYQWQKERLLFLAEHPLCADCLKEKRTTPATEVDHLIPHRGDAQVFWDVSNWQALCKQHHNSKTAREKILQHTQGGEAK